MVTHDWSLIKKKLPAASDFLLVLNTLVLTGVSYFGKELVLNRKQKIVSSSPTESNLEVSDLSVSSPRKESYLRSVTYQ